jgi:hypothetical protein
MKTVLTTIAAISFSWVGSAPLAEARHYENRVYISGYLPCGTPVYTERYFIGYDHCGNPVWGKRTVRPAYRPVVRPVYVAPCPPVYVAPYPPVYVAPRSCEAPHYGTSFTIQGSFRR